MFDGAVVLEELLSSFNEHVAKKLYAIYPENHPIIKQHRPHICSLLANSRFQTKYQILCQLQTKYHVTEVNWQSFEIKI